MLDPAQIITYAKRNKVTHVRTSTLHLAVVDDRVFLLRDTVWIFTAEDYASRLGYFTYLLPIDDIHKLPIQSTRESPSGFDIIASSMELRIIKWANTVAYVQIIDT